MIQMDGWYLLNAFSLQLQATRAFVYVSIFNHVALLLFFCFQKLQQDTKHDLTNACF